jgi:hypothetical protein
MTESFELIRFAPPSANVKWIKFLKFIFYPWRYRLWRTLAGWAAAAGSLSRLHQTVLWVDISNLFTFCYAQGRSKGQLTMG